MVYHACETQPGTSNPRHIALRVDIVGMRGQRAMVTHGMRYHKYHHPLSLLSDAFPFPLGESLSSLSVACQYYFCPSSAPPPPAPPPRNSVVPPRLLRSTNGRSLLFHGSFPCPTDVHEGPNTSSSWNPLVSLYRLNVGCTVGSCFFFSFVFCVMRWIDRACIHCHHIPCSKHVNGASY